MAAAKVIGDVELVCAAEGECARRSQVRQAVMDMCRALKRKTFVAPPHPALFRTKRAEKHASSCAAHQLLCKHHLIYNYDGSWQMIN